MWRLGTIAFIFAGSLTVLYLLANWTAQVRLKIVNYTSFAQSMTLEKAISMFNHRTPNLAVCIQVATSDDGSDQHVFHKFPSSLEELQTYASILSSIQKNNTTLVLLLFSLAYLFKQTFAIPGSVFLNLLAGAIFGLPVGFCLTSTLTGSVYIKYNR